MLSEGLGRAAASLGAGTPSPAEAPLAFLRGLVLVMLGVLKGPTSLDCQVRSSSRLGQG